MRLLLSAFLALGFSFSALASNEKCEKKNVCSFAMGDGGTLYILVNGQPVKSYQLYINDDEPSKQANKDMEKLKSSGVCTVVLD